MLLIFVRLLMIMPIVDIVQKSQLFIFIENESAGNFEIDFIIQGIINRKI